MDYPYSISLNVNTVFENNEVLITFYSGLTTFVGPNASGKTQTLKALRDKLRQIYGETKVRYLSSNRMGDMELYRSKTNQYVYYENDYNVGDQETKKHRHNIETANGDFFTMDERKDVFIKVAERLSVIFNRQIFIRWDAGHMKVFFGQTDSDNEYSVAAEASGLVNIISILAALYDESVEVLLIDEPEVSLHPQFQSYLLREMENAITRYKKTIILSTHSIEMLSLNSGDDLCNFIFFTQDSLPVQLSPDVPELKSTKLKDFLIRMSLIYKEGFFSRKILLVEGVSDLLLCRFLSNKLHLDVDVAGSHIIPVDGKGQFPVVTKLFRLIGKEVSVLTDLDGYIDDNSIVDLFMQLNRAFEIANRHGSENLQEINRNIKTKLSSLISNNSENLTKIYQTHPYWINRDPDTEEIIAKKRAIVAMLLTENDERLSQWPNPTEWKGLRSRIIALFDILEELGCFILRKGAIESYYMFSPNGTFDGKPAAAVNEISGLQSLEMKSLYSCYSDIIKAIEFVSVGKIVDESFAVKKELLCELALVLGVLPKATSEKDLLAAIKQAKGTAKSLFSYRIINEEGRLGVEVTLESNIINVTGLPLKVYVNDNVNVIVENQIHQMAN